jgi:4-amino-4-deoxy-L-arabinose transferase-like glycosyltransferase
VRQGGRVASRWHLPGAPAQVDGAERRFWATLALILAVGFLLRIIVGLLLQDELRQAKGYSVYFNVAENLLAGHGFASGKHGQVQPIGYVQPLYALFLAAQLALVGFTVPAIVLCSAAVSTLTLWVTYLIGRRVFGVGAALVGTALLAVHPLLIWFQMLRFVDTVLTVCLLAVAVWPSCARSIPPPRCGAPRWRVRRSASTR